MEEGRFYKSSVIVSILIYLIINNLNTVESLDSNFNEINYHPCETSDKSIVVSSKKIKLHDCPVTTTLIGRGLEAINQSANRTTHEDQVAVNHLYLFHKGVGNDFFLVTGYCCKWLSMQMKSILSGEKVGTYYTK